MKDKKQLIPDLLMDIEQGLGSAKAIIDESESLKHIPDGHPDPSAFRDCYNNLLDAMTAFPKLRERVERLRNQVGINTVDKWLDESPEPNPENWQEWIKEQAEKEFPILNGFTTNGVSHEIYTGQRWKREGYIAGATAMLPFLEAETQKRIEADRRADESHAAFVNCEYDLLNLQQQLAEKDKEIEDLKRWKKEAISVMPDFQAIGKALKLKLGESVHDKILPAILEGQQLKSQKP